MKSDSDAESVRNNLSPITNTIPVSENNTPQNSGDEENTQIVNNNEDQDWIGHLDIVVSNPEEYSSPTLNLEEEIQRTFSSENQNPNDNQQEGIEEKQRLLNEFMNYVAAGDEENAALLLPQIDINDWNNKYHETALQIAFREEKIDMAKFLVKNGADQKYLMDNLVYAVEQDDMNNVLILLELGVDINGVDCDGFTPLHMATREGNAKMTRFLLENGADIHYIDSHSWTALHELAHGAKDVDTLEVLLEFGVDLLIEGDLLEKEGDEDYERVRASKFYLEDAPEFKKRLLQAEKIRDAERLAEALLDSSLDKKEMDKVIEFFSDPNFKNKVGIKKNENNDPKIDESNDKIIKEKIKDLLGLGSENSKLENGPNSKVENPAKRRKLNPELEKS